MKYYYKFCCRTDNRDNDNPMFDVEGSCDDRKDAEDIHNALLKSPLIVIQGATIRPSPIYYSHKTANGGWVSKAYFPKDEEDFHRAMKILMTDPDYRSEHDR